MNSTVSEDPEALAKHLLAVGWEGLTQEQAEAIAEMPARVGQLLPHPVALALFDILDVRAPRGFTGLPARLGKVLLREKLARLIARSGMGAVKSTSA